MLKYSDSRNLNIFEKYFKIFRGLSSHFILRVKSKTYKSELCLRINLMLSQSLVSGLNFHFEVMEWIERGDMIIICLVRPKYKDRLEKKIQKGSS